MRSTGYHVSEASIESDPEIKPFVPLVVTDMKSAVILSL